MSLDFNTTELNEILTMAKNLPLAGSGSGIIDVAELPTEGIDENAIYRIATQIEVTPLDMWAVNPYGVFSVRAEYEGVNIIVHIVDTLPNDMEATDMVTICNLYVVDSTGIGYINIPGMGTVTVGMTAFETTGMDKGWTDDPQSIDYSNPANYGVYATRPVYNDFVRLFTRKDSQWEEKTAFVNYEGVPRNLIGEYTTGGSLIEVNNCLCTVNVMPYIIYENRIPTILVSVPDVHSLVNRTISKVSLDYFMQDANAISNFTFAGCSQLESIELPDNMLYIGSYAFYDCRSLELSNLPDTIVQICDYAFYNCNKLALTELPSQLREIWEYAFAKCHSLELKSLPYGIKYLSKYAFSYCDKLALTELNVVGSLIDGINYLSIPDYCFEYCVSMPLTKLSENTRSIGIGAFRNCYKLALTEIPESVKRIDSYAFENCEGLTTLTFRGTPEYISLWAFNGCKNLTTINVPWSNGEVSAAPWGATNATINYNYTGE